jgi:hypothetical protein
MFHYGILSREKCDAFSFGIPVVSIIVVRGDKYVIRPKRVDRSPVADRKLVNS